MPGFDGAVGQVQPSDARRAAGVAELAGIAAWQAFRWFRQRRSKLVSAIYFEKIGKVEKSDCPSPLPAVHILHSMTTFPKNFSVTELPKTFSVSDFLEGNTWDPTFTESPRCVALTYEQELEVVRVRAFLRTFSC